MQSAIQSMWCSIDRMTQVNALVLPAPATLEEVRKTGRRQSEVILRTVAPLVAEWKARACRAGPFASERR